MNAPSKNQNRKKVRRTLSMLGKPLGNISQAGATDPATQTSRVSGPYFDANTQTYRVIVFDGGKRKSVGALKSLEEALAIKAEFERSMQAEGSISIGAALDEFAIDKQKQGLKALSISTLDFKLRHFLPLDQSVSSFTADQAQQLYEAETVKISRLKRVMSVQTHRKLLLNAKLFFKWAVGRRYVRLNPFAEVKPIGKPRVGKTQLRIDEARRLTQVLLSAAARGEQGAVAAYTQLVLGLRSSEVLNREVRDLDDEGRVLWIPSGKTDNARRRLEVPDPLRALLLAQAAGKPSECWLFCSSRAEPYHYLWLWRQVTKYCRRAGLQRVCPHSLRGLHSSLAVAAGCTSSVVASALGHGSFAITAQHYVDPDTLRNTALRRVAHALASEPTPAKPPSLLQQLRELSPQELAELLRMLSASTA